MKSEVSLYFTVQINIHSLFLDISGCLGISKSLFTQLGESLFIFVATFVVKVKCPIFSQRNLFLLAHLTSTHFFFFNFSQQLFLSKLRRGRGE